MIINILLGEYILFYWECIQGKQNNIWNWKWRYFPRLRVQQVEQEAKKDTFVSIKNNSNEKVEPSVTDDKKIVCNPINARFPMILLEEMQREIAKPYGK